ncbi:MAG: UDP-3-O-(3-hydroxymyristoyl)glucosamine N-acyltransferase [Gammaproteobacteria bacterium RIFCSPHIGHO2_12_FULL_41_15]|nr:MAG: UDP-3-O-(3-hydroxymyristoyl)glucosamine N-acyltransferase [Gammaproteobacteria bacterium RIFCSPHIGHO2_12_FULL_41_15]
MYTLEKIAQLVDGEVIGDKSYIVPGLSPITDIKPKTLVFADGEENLKLALKSEAGALLLNRKTQVENKPYIQVDHPFKAFIALLEVFYPKAEVKEGVHPTATVEKGAVIGKRCHIGAYVYIGRDCKIGDDCVIQSHVSVAPRVTLGSNCVIYPHVTIYESCCLGAKVIVHANSVIGSDGFGYAFIDGQHMKVPHVGRVIIEDEVEIGANTAIDRATIGDTVIGSGTKIDNFVQIAHSVKIGKRNIICAFTGIAGSSTTGNEVICAANVGISDHVRIDDGVILGARSGVPSRKHLKKGNIYLGNPARPKDKAIENELSVTRIPYLRKQLHELQEQLAVLTAKMADDVCSE